MRFEDLPGSKSVMFHDVPAVTLAILLPSLPPCPILSFSSLQYLALPAPLAFSPTRTLPRHLSVCIHLSSNMFVPSLIPVYCVPIVLPTFSVRDFLSASSSTPIPSHSRPLMHCFTRGLCLDEVGLVLLVGYRASQPKVDCSQGAYADNYVENGAPLSQVKFSYE